MAEYLEPEIAPPYRVLVLMASTDGWYQAHPEEKGAALDELQRIFAQAEVEGARLLASLDDDLFMTGQPASLPYSIYVLYDVDDLATIIRVVHRIRMSQLGRHLRIEVRIGRKLFLLSR